MPTYTFETNWRFTAMVLSICIVLLSPTLAYRMGVDHGTFAFLGSELLEGRWQYLSTWESDFPGLTFLHAFEIFLFGKSIFMFRLFDMFFQLGNTFLIYFITCRLSNRISGYLAAATFCLIYQGYGPWNTAQREGFGLLFILLGFWLYLTTEKRKPVLTAALIGLGFGLAFTIKPTLLAMTTMYFPLLGAINKKNWQLIPFAVTGLAVPIVAIVIIYWSLGGLSEMYDACIIYSSNVYSMRLRGDYPLWQFWLSKFNKLGDQAVGLSILYVAFLMWGSNRREKLMLYLGYLGTIYAVFVQGTFAGYHYLPGLGIGSILVGTMFSQIFTFMFRDYSFLQIWRVRITTQLLFANLVILAAMPIYIKKDRIINLVALRFLDRPYPNEFRNKTVFDFTEDFDVAEYLESHTSRDDTIQVWGYETLVYYLANRHAASRFQMTHPLVMRVPGHNITPVQGRWREEFINDMIEKQPVYIAVVQNDNWWWAPKEQTSEELLDDFPEWKEYIQKNYSFEHTIGRFLIYRRISNF